MSMLVGWLSQLLLWLGREAPPAPASAGEASQGFAAALARHLAQSDEPAAADVQGEGEGREKAAPTTGAETLLTASPLVARVELRPGEPEVRPAEGSAEPGPRVSVAAHPPADGRPVLRPADTPPDGAPRAPEAAEEPDDSAEPAGMREDSPLPAKVSREPAASLVSPAAQAAAVAAGGQAGSDRAEPVAPEGRRMPAAISVDLGSVEAGERPTSSQAEVAQAPGGNRTMAARPATEAVGVVTQRPSTATEARPPMAAVDITEPAPANQTHRTERGSHVDGGPDEAKQMAARYQGSERAALGPGFRQPVVKAASQPEKRGTHEHVTPAGSEARPNPAGAASGPEAVAPAGQAPGPAGPEVAQPVVGERMPAEPQGTAAAVVGQARRALERMAARGQESLRLRLEPEHLGVVDLRITRREDGLQVVLTADRPETGALLTRHLPALRQALAESGVHLAGLSVGEQGTSPGPGAGGGQGWSRPAAPVLNQAESRPQAQASVERRVPEGMVDYRI